MGYNYPIIGGKNGLVVPLPMPPMPPMPPMLPRPGIGGAISFASGAVAAAVVGAVAVLNTLIFLHTEPEFASDDKEVLQTVNEIMG